MRYIIIMKNGTTQTIPNSTYHMVEREDGYYTEFYAGGKTIAAIKNDGIEEFLEC